MVGARLRKWASKVYKGWLPPNGEPVRRAAQCHESPRVGHVTSV